MLIPPPYPSPAQRWWRVFQIACWCLGVSMGAWVLLDPPKSYQSLGGVLTTAWGALIAAGAVLVLYGHVTRKYRVEVPGLVLALGGITIYAYLSWAIAFTESPGAGPRAHALTMLALQIAARITYLLHADREAQKAARLIEEGGGMDE